MLKLLISNLSPFSPFSVIGQKVGIFLDVYRKLKKRGRVFTVFMYHNIMLSISPSNLVFTVFSFFSYRLYMKTVKDPPNFMFRNLYVK